MTALRIFLARLLGLVGGDTRRERELRAEIDAHIAEAAGEYVRQGMTPEAARHAALRQFGGVTQTVEAHRAQRRFTFFFTLRQDLQFAVRTLIRAPGFAIVAILTLAIGILGNTTIFSGVNALLFTPLPTERPEQIAQVLSGGRIGNFVKHTYKRYTSFRDMSTSFAALAAIRDVTVPIGDSAPNTGTANQVGVVRGEVVSGNYFDMLGVRAAQGRAVAPDDDRTPNGHPVVVISDRLWRTHFSADPQTLGRVVYLNGHPFTVIGIAPASFTGTVFANETDFWAPLMMQGQFGAAPNWWSETRSRHIVVHSVRKPGGPTVTGTLDFTPDLRVPGWGLALSLATGLVFGLAPAWQAVRTDLVPSLKPGESGSSHGARRLTLRNALVVAQLSISVVVLVAGGLFVRSLANAREAFSPGFATERLLSMRLDPGLLGYKAPRIDALYRDVLRQLKDVPRIESLSLVSSPPFGSYGSLGGVVTAEGSSPDPASKPIEVGIYGAGPRFFHTMGLSIVAGRDFDERDAAGATPVAILSAAEAERLFGSARNAIGRRVTPPEELKSSSLQVVGVFDNGRKTPGFEDHALYTSFLQHPPGRAMTLVVKAASAGDLHSIDEAVRKSIQKIDPVMPIAEIRKGEDHASPELGAVRLTAEVAMLLGIVALTLASLGLYGSFPTP